MKHGPIALIDEKMPVVCLAPNDRTFDKVYQIYKKLKLEKVLLFL